MKKAHRALSVWDLVCMPCCWHYSVTAVYLKRTRHWFLNCLTQQTGCYRYRMPKREVFMKIMKQLLYFVVLWQCIIMYLANMMRKQPRHIWTLHGNPGTGWRSRKATVNRQMPDSMQQHSVFGQKETRRVRK